MTLFTDPLAAIRDAEFTAENSWRPMAICAAHGKFITCHPRRARQEEWRILEVIYPVGWERVA